MPFSDNPIQSSSQDQFGHNILAVRITDAILDQRNAGANVIGITGKWGVGKSGVLNLIEKEIDRRAKSKTGNDEFWLTPIRFEPWLVGSRSSLIGAFFGQLIQTIDEIREANLSLTEFDTRRYKKTLAALNKKLKTFADLATIAGSGAVYFDPTGTAGAALAVAGAGKALLHRLKKQDSSLETARTEVIAALEAVVALRPNFRIVVFIDDVDRLDPSEAVEIVRLVKAVAGFPFITYVLAYDENILAAAIAKGLAVESGHDYLEKIIQFRLEVPVPKNGALTRWLEVLLRTDFEDDMDFEARRFSAVVGLWARRLLESPRDVIRLLSAMRIMWPPLQGDADFLDLLWLQILKHKANSDDKDLYHWVYEYMVATEAVANGAQVIDKQETGEQLDKILEALKFKKRSNDDDFFSYDPHHLEQMLPGIADSWLSDTNSSKVFEFEHGRNYTEFIAQRRLGSPRHWSQYFVLDSPISALPEYVVKELMSAAENGPDALFQALGQHFFSLSASDGHFTDQLFDERLFLSVEGFSPELALTWFSAVMRSASMLADHSQIIGFVGDGTFFERGIRRIVSEFLRFANVKNYGDLFLSLLEQGAPVWAIVTFLRSENSYHEKVDKGDLSAEREIVISKEAMQSLKLKVSSKFADVTWEQATERDGVWNFLFCWRDIGGLEAASRWLSSNLADDKTLVDRLEKLITYSYSETKNPHLHEAYLRVFVDATNLKVRLKKIAANERRAQKLLDVWRINKEDGF